MGQALYRKYRSKALEEIVGQEHITDTLSRALKGGRISHAYLFTGPRGVGKTSIARILAYEINGLPYDETTTPIDIIEIDAASNNGVEDVRDLREKVYVAPAQAKYKVYIIDEVHMLSKAAFNALLKTLEEPPAHVVFILATTEAHKLPETIISRTQRFIFRPIEPAKAAKHLKTIAKQEKIAITDDAINLIVEHGGGSFRDSISLLDQLDTRAGTIDVPQVQAMLGIAPLEAVEDLLTSITNKRPAADVYKQLTELFNQGYQPANIAKQLAAALRASIINGKANGTTVGALLAALLEVPISHDPEAHLEVVLLAASATAPSSDTTAARSPAPKPVVEAAHTEHSSISSAKKTKSKTADSSVNSSDPLTIQSPEQRTVTEGIMDEKGSTNSTAVLNADDWQQVLNILKKHHNTLYGIIRMAQPDFSTPGVLQLAFNFAFHQKRANEAKNRQLINDAIVSVIGEPLQINCIHDKEAVAAKPILPAGPQPDTAAEVEPAADSLASISNIFGGGELLKSE
jgi:DNA polymerase-3 subunit gamma/tau